MSQDNPDKAAGSAEPDETTAAAPPAPEEATAAAAADDVAPAAAEEELEELDAYVIPAGSVVVTGPSLVARLGAEAFGSFAFVVVGLGLALYSGLSQAGSLAVALGFGLALLAAIIAVGHVSGGHFNPAVTLGAAIGGRTPWKDVVPYWLAQLVGGILAAAVLFITIPKDPPGRDLADRGRLDQVLLHQCRQRLRRALAAGHPVAGHGRVHAGHRPARRGRPHGRVRRRRPRRHRPARQEHPGAVRDRPGVRRAPDRGRDARHERLAQPGRVRRPRRSSPRAGPLGQLWLFWVAPLVGAALAGLVYRAFAAEPVEDNLLEEDDAYVTTDDVVVVTDR